MNMKISDGRIITIDDKLKNLYEKCYTQLTASHIECAINADKINTKVMSDDKLNTVVDNILCEEIEAFLDMMEPSIKKEAFKLIQSKKHTKNRR